MATAKKTTDTVALEEYDFDSWSEDDETKAIEALKPEVRYIIVEKTFVGRFDDGEIVQLPLSISLDDIDRLEAEHPSPVDQVKELLRTLGGDEALKVFVSHDLAATMVMAEKFFKVFSRIAGATFPES